MALWASGVLAAIGCGGGPKLYPVSGIVTIDGQAASNGIVEFIPDKDNQAVRTLAHGQH
jgi:hypothetical protein